MFEMKNDVAGSVSQRTRTRPAGLVSTAPPSSFHDHVALAGCRAPTAEMAVIRNDVTIPLHQGSQLSVVETAALMN